jgi:hypothetical protein
MALAMAMRGYEYMRKRYGYKYCYEKTAETEILELLMETSQLFSKLILISFRKLLFDHLLLL